MTSKWGSITSANCICVFRHKVLKSVVLEWCELELRYILVFKFSLCQLFSKEELTKQKKKSKGNSMPGVVFQCLACVSLACFACQLLQLLENQCGMSVGGTWWPHEERYYNHDIVRCLIQHEQRRRSHRSSWNRGKITVHQVLHVGWVESVSHFDATNYCWVSRLEIIWARGACRVFAPEVD